MDIFYLPKTFLPAKDLSEEQLEANLSLWLSIAALTDTPLTKCELARHAELLTEKERRGNREFGDNLFEILDQFRDRKASSI